MRQKGKNMGKISRAVFVSAADRIRGLPQARRERIEAIAREIAAQIPAVSAAGIPMTKENSAKSRGRVT